MCAEILLSNGYDCGDSSVVISKRFNFDQFASQSVAEDRDQDRDQDHA